MGNNDERLSGPCSHSVIAIIDFNGSEAGLWILAWQHKSFPRSPDLAIQPC